MRRLNYDTLNIIVAVQRLRSFMIADSAIREAAGQEAPSWFKSAESYYSEIPDCVMKVAGLHKNRSDFEKVLNFQVIDADKETMELRGLCSASDSGKLFELRAELREQLIGWLQREYPHALPRRRQEVVHPSPSLAPEHPAAREDMREAQRSAPATR